jgi:L-2-hydroxyglutarate oxidase LhgO
MDTVDVVVVGAGVIGLAVARELALAGREVLILESGARAGTGVSARNSEVVHAGIYYTAGSLKARLCVEGRERLYEFCAQRGVGHRRCGKLIVATSPSQHAALERLNASARANGVELSLLAGAQAQALEPTLRCSAALLSPLTGIIDARALMLALLAEAQAHGALLACNSEVTRAVLETDAVLIAVNGAQPQLRARWLVNCAGLGATGLAQRIEGFPQQHVPRLHLTKGSYFGLNTRPPFSRLIYPLPLAGGVGIHLTLDLAGRGRFGPDVEAVAGLEYAVDAARAPQFYAAIREYWPGLPEGALVPDYAGLRPRISAPGEPLADFRIDDPRRHGVPQILNLFGIESPGLTASLALASEAVSRIR